jgi:hypothetical protein
MGGWMDGWVGGRESGVKDCLQQSKITVLENYQKQWVG